MDSVYSEHLSAAAELIPPEEWYEHLLRLGLYLGAFFQLACILAVLFLPGKEGLPEELEDSPGSSRRTLSQGQGKRSIDRSKKKR
ncbi:Hypothetical protein FKW44_018588 [Caligus rogercresseyi]|uniref:Protein anon-73B1 n=1 Tax=Caligus rogercresseyi TaxID=217165 RepID=A0A7T8GV11_CALRO|nr:Hypothetical protein FKW44_018588 [Caligus rogercresseyi]